MKGIKRFLGVGALALLASISVPKKACAEGWTANFKNTFATQYVRKGILKDNHVVTRPSIDFGRGLGEGKISLSALANLDFHDEEVDRVDLGANYSLNPREDVNVKFDYTRKISKKGSSWKGLDVFLGRVTVDASLQPSLEAEFSVNEGSYFGLSAEQPIYLCQPSFGGRTLTAGVELGYNVHAFRRDAGFSHFETYLSVPITMPRSGFLSNFKTDLKARYSASLADDIQNHWIVELNASKSF